MNCSAAVRDPLDGRDPSGMLSAALLGTRPIPVLVVNDLSVQSVVGPALVLAWTAPQGEDGQALASLDLRLSATDILDDTACLAATAAAAQPGTADPGTTQQFSVPGLVAASYYSFCMRTQDQIGSVGTWSSPTAVSASTAIGAVNQNALIAWVNFNGNLTDKQGLLTLSPTPPFTLDRNSLANRAADLTGGASITATGVTASFPRTVGFWIRITNAAPTLTGVHSHSTGSCGTTLNGYTFTLQPSRMIDFAVVNGPGVCASASTTALTQGTWYYLAGVIEAGQLTLYYGPAGGSLTTVGPMAAAPNSFTGTLAFSTADSVELDDFVIYSRALSPAEVTANFQTDQQ